MPIDKKYPQITSYTASWDIPTRAQKDSIKNLIEILKKEYNLTNNDIYEHDDISPQKLEEKQKICMRKIKLIWLLCCNIIFANPIPPYAHLWEIQPIEVLEVDTEINWKNSGLSNQEALEYCKNTQSLPKDSKQMEQYLKKHIVVWSLHYFGGAGCTYKGKVKFAGKIWNFVSIGGITRLTTESEWIELVCISKDCYPQAWSDGE